MHPLLLRNHRRDWGGILLSAPMLRLKGDDDLRNQRRGIVFSIVLVIFWDFFALYYDEI